MKITVACVNVGIKFAPEYVHKLHGMVQRHLTLPHEFICFTDKPERYEGVPFQVRKELSGHPGWWAKIGLFNSENGLRGRVLYLDLDIVIVRNINALIAPGGFWILRDWLDGGYNSSVMLFDGGKYAFLYEQFSWRDMGLKTDQHYIAHKLKDVHFFDPKQVVSYKHDHCEDGIPDDARIIVFHGYPKPPDCGGWVREHWILNTYG